MLRKFKREAVSNRCNCTMGSARPSEVRDHASAMPRFDQTCARCDVYTFKEGLLSAAAHDLRIAVTRFSIDLDVDSPSATATFDARSLKTAAAMRGAVEMPEALSDRDRRTIDRHIVDDVLLSARHPEISFVTTRVVALDGGWTATGTLTMLGRAHPIALDVRRERGALLIEGSLRQSDFGIRPFTAMLGTLKVRSEVRVKVVIQIG